LAADVEVRGFILKKPTHGIQRRVEDMLLMEGIKEGVHRKVGPFQGAVLVHPKRRGDQTVGNGHLWKEMSECVNRARSVVGTSEHCGDGACNAFVDAGEADPAGDHMYPMPQVYKNFVSHSIGAEGVKGSRTEPCPWR
jgi:hypothetical protein